MSTPEITADWLRARLIQGWISSPDPQTPIGRRAEIIKGELDKIQSVDTLDDLYLNLDMRAVQAMYPSVAEELQRWSDLRDDWHVYLHHAEPVDYDPRDAAEARMNDEEGTYLSEVESAQADQEAAFPALHQHMLARVDAFGDDPRVASMRSQLAKDAALLPVGLDSYTEESTVADHDGAALAAGGERETDTDREDRPWRVDRQHRLQQAIEALGGQTAVDQILLQRQHGRPPDLASALRTLESREPFVGLHPASDGHRHSIDADVPEHINDPGIEPAF